jgi:hypothetical protein
VRAVILLSFPAVFTQVSGGDWPSILQAYGAAAPFAALCLWVIYETRRDNKRLNEQIVEAIPALAESSRLVAENTENLARVSVMMHQMAARPVGDPMLLLRLVNALEKCEEHR